MTGWDTLVVVLVGLALMALLSRPRRQPRVVDRGVLAELEPAERRVQ